MADMRGPNWVHGNAATLKEYLALHKSIIANNVRRYPGRFAGMKVRDADAAAVAYINHGRWLVDCTCGNGCSTCPEWGVACCMSCGLVWRSVQFPQQAEAICEELSKRRPENQNWSEGESVADLFLETELNTEKP